MADDQLKNDIICGKNAVAEFLKNNGRADTVYLAVDDAAYSYYCALAKEPARKLDFMCGTERHGGVAASVKLIEYTDAASLLRIASEKGEPPFIIIADGISDPHNLGAILRTAECCGAHGVIIPERGGCQVTPAVMATSAGAASAVPVAREGNLASAVRMLKEQGVFVYSADMDGEYCCGTNLLGPIALVVGSEGFGVSQLLKKLSDGIISLPMYGKINSLNASVAAGVLMYEIVRQRRAQK